MINAYNTMYPILLNILSFPDISTLIMRRIFCSRSHPPALASPRLKRDAVVGRFREWAQANQHLGLEHIRNTASIMLYPITQLEDVPASSEYMRLEVADRYLVTLGY